MPIAATAAIVMATTIIAARRRATVPGTSDRRTDDAAMAHAERIAVVAASAPTVVHDDWQPSEERLHVPKHVMDRQESNRKTAKHVQRLLELRSRLDRAAWNTLGYGPLGSHPSPLIHDWNDRCMFLTMIGMAFEDLPEVLGNALAEPDGHSVRREMLVRVNQAYDMLAGTRVPTRWNHDAMEGSWRRLCEAVAEIIGQEPRYGTALPPAPTRRPVRP